MPSRFQSDGRMVEFDLRKVPQGQRAAAWRRWHTELYRDGIEHEGAPAGQELDGSLQYLDLGDARLLRVRSAFPRVRKKPVAGQTVYFAALAFLQGTCELRQSGRQPTLLHPGELLFLQSGRTLDLELTPDSDMVLFQAPLGLVRAVQPGALRRIDCKFSPDDAGTRYYLNTMCEALRLGTAFTEAQRRDLAQHLITGLAMPAMPFDAAVSRTASLVEEALSVVEAHLGERDLVPERVAEAIGMSRRRLDDVFVREMGRPLAPIIWECRLGRARGLLADPRHAQMTVTDVAFSVGFENAAHFSRAFKRRFGLTPSAFRLAQAGAS